MRTIELEIDRLVGFSTVGSDENRIKKLGSAKIGNKCVTEMAGEVTASAERAHAAA